MPDAPTPWEHQRALEQLRTDLASGLGQLNQRLDRLVSNDAFVAEQRRVDDKLKDLADDIQHEARARANEMAAERKAREDGDQRQQDALDRLIANQKWIVVAILIPVALFIANIVLRGT